MISSTKIEEMSSGNDEKEMQRQCKGNAEGSRRQVGFSLCIAKILQGLRKFRNHSENFAILAKISLCTFFC